MTKKEYMDMFGSDPIDTLGGDWQNYLADFDSEGNRIYATQ
jgi:hypothetical protein